MFTLWSQVDSNGTVVGTPFQRPAAFRLNDGTIVDLTVLPDIDLAAYGLFPYTYVNDDFDPIAQIQIAPTVAFDKANGVVVATCNYIDRDVGEAQGAILERINAQRDALLDGGWLFNGVRYDSDARSVQNMAGTQTLINAGLTLPSTFVWRAHDNTDHAFDNATFLWFFIGASQWRSAAFTVSWVHKAAVSALTSSHDVAAYDFTKGWILGYNVGSSGLEPVVS